MDREQGLDGLLGLDEALGEEAQQCERNLWPALAEPVELVVGDDERLDVGRGRDGRGAELAGERRHLAEAAPRSELSDDLPVAEGRVDRDLGLPTDEDEHVGARLELAHDRAARRVGPASRAGVELGERFVVDLGEHRDLAQEVHGSEVGHGDGYRRRIGHRPPPAE